MSEAPAASEVKRRRASRATLRPSFACPNPNCGWPYPIVLAQLSEQTPEQDRTVKSTLVGFMNRCPVCEWLYFNTPLGQKRYNPQPEREPRRPTPPEEPPRVQGEPRAPYVEVPADQLRQWETGEPGGPG